MTKRIGSFVLAVLIAAPVVAQDREAIVATLKVERAKYTAPLSPAQLGQLLNDVAAKHSGWGLLRKDAGNVCPAPSGVNVSCDWLIHRSGVGCDAIGDSEGAAVVACGSLEQADASRFVAPTTDGGTPPPPPPPPPPSGAATADLQRAQLDELRDQVAILTQILAQLGAQTEAITRALADVKAEIAKGIKIRTK